MPNPNTPQSQTQGGGMSEEEKMIVNILQQLQYKFESLSSRVDVLEQKLHT